MMYGLVQALKAIVLMMSVGAINAFAGVANSRWVPSVGRSGTQLEAITEVGSLDEFDDAVSAAGANVMVIHYSTTWCGPCNFVSPKYEAMSEIYENVVFLKVWPFLPYAYTHANAPSHSSPATNHSI
jgi:thiol-disulfide isomerase/thioredoxin